MPWRSSGSSAASMPTRSSTAWPTSSSGRAASPVPDSHADARPNGSGAAWSSVDDAHARYRIEEDGGQAAAKFWVVGGVYSDTRLRAGWRQRAMVWPVRQLRRRQGRMGPPRLGHGRRRPRPLSDREARWRPAQTGLAETPRLNCRNRQVASAVARPHAEVPQALRRRRPSATAATTDQVPSNSTNGMKSIR